MLIRFLPFVLIINFAFAAVMMQVLPISGALKGVLTVLVGGPGGIALTVIEVLIFRSLARRWPKVPRRGLTFFRSDGM